MPNQPFDAETRYKIIHSYFPLDEIQDNWPLKVPSYQRAELNRRYHTLVDQYRAGLHLLPLSRCPFCQYVQFMEVDPIDLDGLWWAGIESKQKQDRCFHYWTLSGAVRLADVIAPSPLLVLPGPQVPFVVPQVLQNPAIRVVISSFPVGAHLAYPIFYYSEIKPMRVDMPFPYWRDSSYYRWTQNDAVETGSSIYNMLRYDADFNLAPWIEVGKVFWIAPGDESLTLRKDITDCPYLNLSDSQKLSSLQEALMYSRRFGWLHKDRIDLDTF